MPFKLLPEFVLRSKSRNRQKKTQAQPAKIGQSIKVLATLNNPFPKIVQANDR
jgi:hypothetical protein